MVWVSTLSAKRSRRTGARPGTLETARPGMGRQVGLLICPTAAVHCASQHTDKTANAPSIACGKFKRTVELGRHHKAPLGEGLVPSSKISAACSWAFRVRSQPEHSAGGRRVAILSTEKTQFRQKYEIGIACLIPMFGNANGRRQIPPATLAGRHVATGATLAAISRDLGPQRARPNGRRPQPWPCADEPDIAAKGGQDGLTTRPEPQTTSIGRRKFDVFVGLCMA